MEKEKKGPALLIQQPYTENDENQALQMHTNYFLEDNSLRMP